MNDEKGLYQSPSADIILFTATDILASSGEPGYDPGTLPDDLFV